MIKLIADSTCDLDQELATKYDVSILPLHVVLGEDEYIDGVNISPDMIYKWSDLNDDTPKTSAPSIDDAIKMFEPIINNGDEIIAFSISKEISSSGNVMLLAAEELDATDKIKIIDSRSLCYGISLLVIKARQLIDKGCSLDEIYETISNMTCNISASFIVDELTYLHRGGRCSSIAAMASSVIKLHPVIDLVDGKLISGSKYRGKMNKVIDTYVIEKMPEIVNKGCDMAIVAYTGDLEEACLSIKDNIINEHVFDNVLLLKAGSVIASHCGPNTFGLFYITRD